MMASATSKGWRASFQLLDRVELAVGPVGVDEGHRAASVATDRPVP